MNAQLQTAAFGGRCFWCTEAVFQNLKGIMSVTPGYAGGHVKKPTYEQVCRGTTGHAEVIRIEFDPQQISYRDLLEVFFATHDPTTLNRQGNDVGKQYRSALLYTSEEQKLAAREFIKELQYAGAYSQTIVTEVAPLRNFNKAEDYHVRYYENNPSQPYCRAVINPKLKKFKEKYASLLKM